jgi:molybdate transport system substrate-binding protein
VQVKGLDDLTKAEVKKIAIANPDFAPYGMAAKQALKHKQLWDQLQPKIVRGESVRQALQFVESGNAEAGLVGRAIAQVKGIEVIPLDQGLYEPIVQALGVVSRTKRPADAQAFADFMNGEVAQGILAEFGFLHTEPASEAKPVTEEKPRP